MARHPQFDAKRVGQALLATAEFYQRNMKPATLNMMLSDLEHLDSDTILQALNAHRRNPERGKFMPLSADLLEHTTQSLEEQAAEAWALVAGAMRRYGTHQSVRFADARISHAIQIAGGWGALGRCNESDLPFRRRDFMAAWSSLARDITRKLEPITLVGQSPGPDVVVIESDYTATREPMQLTHQPGAGRISGMTAQLLEHTR